MKMIIEHTQAYQTAQYLKMKFREGREKVKKSISHFH